MFLLDPLAAQKTVHKECLEKLQHESSKLKGWVTKWDVGKMQGADPTLAKFEELCDLAVEGLPSRPHEGLGCQGCSAVLFGEGPASL